MEKQSNVVLNTLQTMSKAGILDHVLLIGSWGAYFYKYYFSRGEYNPVIKTRDIDFLVRIKPKFPKRVDVEELLSPLGFEMEFYGRGFMKLESDELAIEFLAPEVGRPAENPLPIPDLRMNAQPMRHLSILWRNPIRVRISGFSVLLPHPADYCVQKLVVASRRRKSAKAEKDRVGAMAVLDAISENGELPELRKALKSLSKKELKTVAEELRRADREGVLT